MAATSLKHMILPALLAGGLMLATPVAAQDSTPRKGRSLEQRVEAHVKQLDEKLDLSAEQEARMRTVLTERMQAAQKQMQTAAKDRAQRMEQMTQHRAEMDEAIGSVLTADQKAKYQELRAARAERLKERRPQANLRGRRDLMQRKSPVRNSDRAVRGSAMNGRQLDKALDLTDEQQKQVQEVLQRNREEMQAQRKVAADSARVRLQERQARLDAEISSLLTPEQRSKYDELKKQRRSPRQR